MPNPSDAEENRTLATENMIIATRWHEKMAAKYIAASLRMASRRLFIFVPRFVSLKMRAWMTTRTKIAESRRTDR